MPPTEQNTISRSLVDTFYHALTVISYVFALRVDAVQIQASQRFNVAAVLIDDALSLFEISFSGCLSPPISQVAYRVVLTSLIIKAYKSIVKLIRLKITKAEHAYRV